MSILIKPIITEKMSAQTDKMNRFGFIVDGGANKIQIKQAVEEMYGVAVDAVNTMNYAGKRKVRYTKSGMMRGKSNNYKKAVVTLAAGDTIDFFSNI